MIESLQWLLLNGYDVSFHAYRAPGMGWSSDYVDCKVTKRKGLETGISYKIKQIESTEFATSALEYNKGDALKSITETLVDIVKILQNQTA